MKSASLSAMLFAVVFSFSAANARANVGLNVNDTSSSLVAQTARYSIQIQKAPYGLTILVGNKELLKSAVGAGNFFLRDEKLQRFERVKSWQEISNGLQLIVSSTLASVDGEILFYFFEDHLQIEMKTLDQEQNAQIGASFILKTGRHWYGGNVTSAHDWPLETGSMVLDPFYSTSNQTSPIWLSSSGSGILVPTYQLMGFSIDKDNDGLFSFHVKDADRLSYQLVVRNNIVEAFSSMVQLVGRPRQVPPREYFTQPIFNSWIEFHTEVNQKGLEVYVQQIKAHGFASRIVEIDDKWSTTYGDFVFDSSKFPDPKSMIERFHSMGLRVILWATPFFEKSSKNYQLAEKNRYLIMDGKGDRPYITEWWDGHAALVDLSNPKAYEWFLGLLQNLVREYGIDGFKLDAGDGEFLAKPFTSFGQISSSKYTDLYASIGRFFDINELRVSWMVQELGLVQRLRDKDPTWSPVDGLNSLIPHGLAEGLIGYQYFCPDIIGGGLDSGFYGPDAKGIDAELFVRWTEASALMPMMQYSYAPWRMEEKFVSIVRKYSKLHEDLGNYIYSLAVKASRDGTPIIRPLFFRNPEDERTYGISTQFMLGDRFLVAPVLKKGASCRDIYLPQGTWADFWSGKIFKGGQMLKDHPAPLEVLPIFISIEP